MGADGAQHIYTLQGKRVRGAWKQLPGGVHVMNEKKKSNNDTAPNSCAVYK